MNKHSENAIFWLVILGIVIAYNYFEYKQSEDHAKVQQLEQALQFYRAK